MSGQVLAIAICRVSTSEQLANGSLPRQRRRVLEAAKKLGATIPDEYWFSGNVSSKRGTNLKRKDLIAIIKLCKKDKRIKYVIVDEPDRFMRSIDEAIYYEVEFSKLGVKVWYASNDALNNGDLMSKIYKISEYWKAEGSNDERIQKSISGQTDALKAGRYPFHPKPGYRRGVLKGIPEIDEVRGPALKDVLERLAAGIITPTQALQNLNRSDFVKDHATYTMDKFRKIATDPFYAGILDINKQVKVRNINGAHDTLISLDTHKQLVRIFTNKKKNQSGPLKDGNPKYPCNNIVHCDNCKDSPYNRVVGYDLTNGKPNSKVYERYRCRECLRIIWRDELHGMITQQLSKHSFGSEGREMLQLALRQVWKEKEGDLQQEKTRMENKLAALRSKIDSQVEAAIDPTNSSIKTSIMDSIERNKAEADELEYNISKLRDNAKADEERFMQFALAWVEKMGENFLSPELSKENRLRCKQILFPAGFHLDKNLKVYTPEVSPLITLAATKKDAEASDLVQMVRVGGL